MASQTFNSLIADPTAPYCTTMATVIVQILSLKGEKMALYSTDDIYIASALKTGGMKFQGISMCGNRGVFEFEDSPRREKLITNFYSGELTQNVREYVNNWINFKRLVARLSSSDR